MFGISKLTEKIDELLELLESDEETSEKKEKQYTEEIIKLKNEISDLNIEKSKIVEDNEKQERELRHMIGLEKKRQEFEIDAAKREAELKVREENLTREKQEFERQLKFNTERFEKMESYLKEMFKDVLARLPNVDMKIRENRTNG